MKALLNPRRLVALAGAALVVTGVLGVGSAVSAATTADDKAMAKAAAQQIADGLGLETAGQQTLDHGKDGVRFCPPPDYKPEPPVLKPLVAAAEQDTVEGESYKPKPAPRCIEVPKVHFKSKCDWIRAHGVNPNKFPVPATVIIAVKIGDETERLVLEDLFIPASFNKRAKFEGLPQGRYAIWVGYGMPGKKGTVTYGAFKDELRPCVNPTPTATPTATASPSPTAITPVGNETPQLPVTGAGTSNLFVGGGLVVLLGVALVGGAFVMSRRRRVRFTSQGV